MLWAAADSPCGLAELCSRTGLPRATAHRLAVGLEVHRLLHRGADGRWRPGPALGELSGTSTDPLLDAAAAVLPRGVGLDWFTTRERDQTEVLPWDHLDSGLDKDWLWQDWQDSRSGFEQDDCRWTPCFDCGVCPGMDTGIQVGPTGRTLLPLTPV